MLSSLTEEWILVNISKEIRGKSCLVQKESIGWSSNYKIPTDQETAATILIIAK